MKTFIKLVLLSFVCLYSGNVYAKDTVSPTAKITAPSGGIYVKGTYTIKADATDNVGVTRVLFYVDQYLFAKYTDTSAPYSYNWDTTKVLNGAHTLKVRAYDASGRSTLSSGVTVTVDNTAPTVSLTSPAAGQVSGVVKISAAASDNIAGVQFLVDGVNLGSEDTAAPYEINWDTAGKSGTHALTALARDKAGNTKLSSPVQVTILVPDQAPPSVNIASPASNSIISAVTTVKADASDDVGVVGVQFKLDGQNLGLEVTASPYQASLDTVSFSNGSHALTAVARDAAGNSTTSASVSVNIQNTTVPPVPGGRTVKRLFKSSLIWNKDIDEIPFVAEHYDMFVLVKAGQSKIERLRGMVGNGKPIYNYLKIGGVHDGTGDSPIDTHWGDTVNADLLWAGKSSQNVKHSQNGWYYTDIIRELKSGYHDWSRILVDLIYRKPYDSTNNTNKSIYDLFDGVFWDNAGSDMDPFIYDSGYTLDTTCSAAGGKWEWIDIDTVKSYGCIVAPTNYSDQQYYDAVNRTLRDVANSPELAGWGKMILNSYLGYMNQGLRGMELLQTDSQGRGAGGIMFEGLSIKMDGKNPLRPRSRLVSQLKDFRTIVHLSPACEAYGMNYILLNRIPNPDYPDDTSKDIFSAEKVVQLRRLSLASYLLVSNENSFLILDAIDPGGDGSGAQYFPEYDLDLGSPADSNFTGSDTSGLLTRKFEKGLVILNPDYWGGDGVSADGPVSSSMVLPTVPGCTDSEVCHYEEIVLSGGGDLQGTPGTISAGRTFHKGDTVTLLRTDAIILKSVKN